jgi:glycosyltransferase involved in cell wall biosynthesis
MTTAHAYGESAGPGRDVDAAAALAVAGVDPELGFGGGETQVLGLTLELRRGGHRAELICDAAGRLFAAAREAGVVCHALPSRNSLDVRAGMRLRAILTRERFDVVHFHTARAHAMAPYARGLARALVVTRRMDYPPNRIFAPYLFGRAVDGVAAISRSVAAALATSGVDAVRVEVIPSGVDCAHFRPPSAAERAEARARLGIADGVTVIAAVGALEPRKGHRDLIRAVSRLLSTEPANVICIIAGDGAMRDELEREVASLSLDGVVRLPGHSDSRAILWACDVFAFPSLKEGLGVALLEAMACGLPAVACDAGGIADAVNYQRTGILVRPADPVDLAAGLLRPVRDPSMRASMGAAARERAEREFSMTAMARRTLALYRNVLRKCLDAGAARGQVK